MITVFCYVAPCSPVVVCRHSGRINCHHFVESEQTPCNRMNQPAAASVTYSSAGWRRSSETSLPTKRRHIPGNCAAFSHRCKNPISINILHRAGSLSGHALCLLASGMCLVRISTRILTGLSRCSAQSLQISGIHPIFVRVPRGCNFSSTLYPRSCWCIIQVIHSL
jgi:hypothetical protein